TSHSIAAMRAALSDAKFKFFGINKNDRDVTRPPASCALTSPQTHTPRRQELQRREPNYQNVPQPRESSCLQPMRKTMSPDQSLRYGTTYKQIPLSDLDAQLPSQAVYMSTTVPQNMKGKKIAGRHTPTRNSLRHSRMIVVNNTPHESIRETYFAHIRNSNFSRHVLILQLAIGLLILPLAYWIFVMESNVSLQINSYLSGLFLLLASIVGLILLRRSRRFEYHISYNKCQKLLLIESYVICCLAMIFCSLNLIIAAIEFTTLTSMLRTNNDTCEVYRLLLGYRNCGCVEEGSEVTKLEPQDVDNAENGKGLKCDAIHGDWKYLLAFSMALNTMGIVTTFTYIAIFICRLRNNRKNFNTSF
ncbi:hypothetical protein KR222_010684, partial [Zaprionus bogoriensis]